MTKTTGQYLVGVDFNPSNSDLVHLIKSKAAELIDLIESIPVPGGAAGIETEHRHAIARCRAIAVTNIEQGAMLAVKAATKQPKEQR